jgi:RNA polymerase sigma-B factor
LSTAASPATSEVVAIRPGDPTAAAEGTGWLQEFAASRDPALRERIILAYLGLADRLAMRYRHSRGTSLEDLTQTARAGLIAAVDRYDPARNQSFVPYAVASVVGELKRHLRDTSWRLHVARPRKEHVLRLCRATDALAQQLGRPPTVAELCDHLDLSEEVVLDTMEAAQSRQEISLDRPVGDTPETSLGELVADPGPREEPEDLLLLTGLVASLPDLERQIIVMRFFDELKQDTIAARLGCSQMHVSRLLRRALARLRTELLVP